MRNLPVVFLVTSLLVTVAGQLSADVIPVEIEILEIMMEATAADGELLGRVFGVDPANTLSFTGNIDTENKAFSYAFDPESTYTGMPISIEGSGAYDDGDGHWYGQVTMIVPPPPPFNPWAPPIELIPFWEVVPDNPGPSQENLTFYWEVTIPQPPPLDPYIFDAYREIVWESTAGGGSGTSHANLWYSKNDLITGHGEAVDSWIKHSDHYEYEWFTFSTAPWNPYILLEGIMEPTTGDFTGTMMVIPEPTTLLLLGLGGFVLRLVRSGQVNYSKFVNP